MKWPEFKKLFPYADSERFSEEFGTMIFRTRDNFGYDVEEPAFWDNEKFVKFLNLPSLGREWYEDNPENFLSQ